MYHSSRCSAAKISVIIYHFFISDFFFLRRKQVDWKFDFYGVKFSLWFKGVSKGIMIGWFSLMSSFSAASASNSIASRLFSALILTWVVLFQTGHCLFAIHGGDGILIWTASSHLLLLLITHKPNTHHRKSWATWLCLEKSALAAQMYVQHNRSTTRQINGGPAVGHLQRPKKKGLSSNPQKYAVIEWRLGASEPSAIQKWQHKSSVGSRCSSVPLNPQAVLRLPALSLSAVSVQAN